MVPLSSRRDLAAALDQARAQLRRSRREIRNLRQENEILRDAAKPSIHQATARDRFALVHTHRDRFSLKLPCRVLIAGRGNHQGWVRPRQAPWTHRQISSSRS